MTDDEAATLLGIAYSAILMLPVATSRSRVRLQSVMATLVDEIARLRHRTPEDIQNEFETRKNA